MMRFWIISVIVAVCGLLSFPSYAQDDVTGLWTSLNVKKNIDKQFSLTLRGEYRCKDNFSSDELYFVRLTGTYKICDYLSTAVAYDYFNSRQGKSTVENLSVDEWIKHSHRILADLSGNCKVSDVTFSLRERYVYSYNMRTSVAAKDEAGMYVNYDTSAGSSHLLRSYPNITYRIPSSAFSPYVAAEFFNSLNNGDSFKLQQWHLFVGTGIRIDKVNSLKVFYVMQTKLPSGKRIHCIGLDYTITLP